MIRTPSFTFCQIPDMPDIVSVYMHGHADNRGTFHELFRDTEFRDAGLHGPWVQDNIVSSRKNVVRGLHYQVWPCPQGKLVTCLHGVIFDVCVDIHPKSQTYGHHYTRTLTPLQHTALYIPPGFAHGYAVITDRAVVLYKCSKNRYSKGHERTIRWDDPHLNISWPIETPILSEKDEHAPSFRDAEPYYQETL